MAKELVVPLRRKFVKTPRHRRAKKAVTVLKEFLYRHTKADTVKIGQHLNEEVWARGMRNPPGKVKVSFDVQEKDGEKIAKVELFGKQFKESIRPEERVEQEGGLKGKLQQLTQGKDKPEEANADEAKADEKAAEKPAAPVKTAKKTPVKTAKSD